MIEKKKSSLIAIYFTSFMDALSWAVVFPIFAPYFLDVNHQIFSPQTTLGTKMILLGLFLMAFSLGQFMGAPLIQEYADKYGRKKALTITVFCTFLGLALSAWSMQENQLIFLFLGRLITGFFASNSELCLSSISDSALEKQEKDKYFNYFTTIAGFAFLIGAFVGGKLADKTVSAVFFSALPLWFAAFLTLVNWIFVVWGLQKTKEMHPGVKFHFWGAFEDLKLALQTKKIRQIYTVYFLFIFSWVILFQFLPVLTVQKLSYTSSNLGDLALFMGICWAIGSGYLNKVLAHYFNTTIVLEVCLIGFTVFCGMIVIASHFFAILAILGLCIIFGAIAWPMCASIISSMTPKEMEGKTLAMEQAAQSFAMAIGPIIGAIAYALSINYPFFLASFSGCIAVGLYFFLLKHH